MMSLIKKILKPIVKIIAVRDLTEDERNNLTKRCLQRSALTETRVNPATGLPMTGCLDLNGSSYGTSNSFNDYHRSTDHFRSNSFGSY
ncbi:hypothetical protein J2N86_15705 (plasmid) [Legionella lytica]|uniref:Uncharacterized protein n=1 Tax=Legionella lytica TaxID=96232 RepID=A0ABY4YEE0_9GAMM|nr:hypothetical protein [Legionella lytica]USQ15590.1 hypothetical protein J2N86_15705 [Legionella lytica]